MSGTPRGWPGQGLPPGPPALVAAVHGEGVAARAPRAATRWSYALLLVFLLLLYACVPLLFPSFGWLAIAQVTAIAALVAVVAERIAARAAFRLAWPEGYLVVALLGVAAVSTFTALWPRYAFDNTLTIAKCVAAFLLLVNTVETWPRLRQTLGVLVVGGAIPAAGALDYMAHGHYAAGHRIGWLGIFLNSNDLAFAMVVLVAPAVALATTSRSWWRRGACWLAVGLYAAVVYLTYSRGGLIGLGISPPSTIRRRLRCSTGSGTGAADNRARV